MGNFGRKLYKEPNVSNVYGFYMNKRNFTTLKWIIFLSGRETSGHMSLIAVSAFPKDKFKHLRSLFFNESQCLWVKVKNCSTQHIIYKYLSMK